MATYHNNNEHTLIKSRTQAQLRIERKVVRPPVQGHYHTTRPVHTGAEVGVDIGAGTYKATVMVSAWIERPNFIIGADCLSARDCDLSLREKLFLIGE